MLYCHYCIYIRSILLYGVFFRFHLGQGSWEKAAEQPSHRKGKWKRVSVAVSCVSMQVREKEKHSSVIRMTPVNKAPVISVNTHKYYANVQTECAWHDLSHTHKHTQNGDVTPPPQWRVCGLSLIFLHIHNFLIQQVCARVFVGSVLPFALTGAKLVSVTSPQTAASCPQVEKKSLINNCWLNLLTPH